LSAEGERSALTLLVDRLSKENECLSLRVKELEKELATYQWKPLTPADLPQFGDLVLMEGCIAAMIKNFNKKWPYMHWYRCGWRWFAKLRLPDEVKDQNRKMQ
jgi:hypothetical protein